MSTETPVNAAPPTSDAPPVSAIPSGPPGPPVDPTAAPAALGAFSPEAVHNLQRTNTQLRALLHVLQALIVDRVDPSTLPPAGLQSPLVQETLLLLEQAARAVPATPEAQVVPCPTCEGNPSIYLKLARTPCPTCAGAGKVLLG